jgi:hypothetical protein
VTPDTAALSALEAMPPGVKYWLLWKITICGRLPAAMSRSRLRGR